MKEDGRLKVQVGLFPDAVSRAYCGVGPDGEQMAAAVLAHVRRVWPEEVFYPTCGVGFAWYVRGGKRVFRPVEGEGMPYMTKCAKCGKAIGFDVAPKPGKMLLCRSCTDGWNAWAASQRGMASGLHEANEPRPEPPVEPDHLTPVLCTGDFMRGPELDPRRKR